MAACETIGADMDLRLLLLVAVLLGACGRSGEQLVSSERFVLIEHMQVVGTCAEEGGRASTGRLCNG